MGAGPGDPSLITVRGRECLQQAEVVIHDFLLNPALLAWAPNAEIINAAEPAERHPRPIEQIIALMIEKARQGKRVVRLKGGDPLVFGRGGEEALALAEAGIPFEIVPGVTSATAVPTYAGIPITQRGVASSLAVIAGHNLDNAEALDWPRLAHGADTLLFLMGIQQLPYIVDHLLAAGRAPDTPIAVVEQGTHPGQRTVTGTLADIAAQASAAAIRPPATIIVGQVVKLRERLRWFDRPDLNPLFGLRLLTIHSGREAPAAELNGQLTAHGAKARSLAAQAIGPAPSFQPFLDWLHEESLPEGAPEGARGVIFAGPAAVEGLARMAPGAALAGLLRPLAVVCIGPETAEAAAALFVRVDGVAADLTAESVAEALRSWRSSQ